MIRNTKLLFFLFGLGIQLQVIASLSFTEIFVFLAAPILYTHELPYMRRNGIMPLWWLSMAVVANCVVSIIANHTPFQAALRGMAVVCLLPCSIVVAHWLLRKNMNGFKWMLVGVAISGVLCTFVFQKAVEVSGLAQGAQSAEDVSEAIMRGPIFWITRLSPFVMLFPKGWYLQCPTVFAAGFPLGMAVFAMLTTASGRSAALGAVGAAMLVVLGGKRPQTIKKRVCKNFWLLCLVGIAVILIFKTVYQVAASSGALGEQAREKYEHQTQGDKSIKKLLLGGRMDSFCGLIACVDKPIVGFGPWARDGYGYAAEFLQKYGTYDDCVSYLRSERIDLQNGFAARLIPCHSHITMYWLWYGIFGLIFWLYVLYLLFRYLCQDCFAVPQWYVWLAASIPGFCWSVFFSAVSGRVEKMVFVVAVLMVRAVRKGAQKLPGEMRVEIVKCERRC